MSVVRRLTALVCVASLIVVTVASGCAPPQKPKELSELNRILGEEGANKVKEYPGAAKYYSDARKLRDVALEKYDERKLDLARHYAIRGKISYRTAAAIADQVKANERLEEANDKIASVNPEIKKLEQEREKLRQETIELKRRIRLAKREDQAADRREQLAAAQQEAQKGKQELQEKARRALEAAVEARDQAKQVKADQFAKALYNKANNQLKSAQTLMRENPQSAARDVVSAAQGAEQSFKKAAEEAKPDYEEYLAKQNPQQRRESLTEKLEFNFGGEYVQKAPRGVRAILVETFPEGSTDVAGQARSKLSTVADLAKQFDEFNLLIEGYTRKGDPTENLTISQVRARNAKQFLTGQGIDSDRIDTSGEGQSRARYEDEAAKNDRVEIIFRLAQ